LDKWVRVSLRNLHKSSEKGPWDTEYVFDYKEKPDIRVDDYRNSKILCRQSTLRAVLAFVGNISSFLGAMRGIESILLER
jgi:hypothetical protein